MKSFSPGKKDPRPGISLEAPYLSNLFDRAILFIYTLHISASDSYSLHFSTPHSAYTAVINDSKTNDSNAK